MRIKERREKCDMTEHLIEILLLNLVRMNFVRRDNSVFKIRASGARTILLLAASSKARAEIKYKAFEYAHCVQIFSCKMERLTHVAMLPLGNILPVFLC